MNFFLSLLLSLLVVQATQFDIYADKFPQDQTHDPDNTDLSTYYGHLNNASLLWGPYRSSLYFGVRPRLPRSLLSGLMWFSVNDYSSVGKIRHFYQQHDQLKKANWVKYDPRYGGRQVIDDDEFHVTITIDFVKSEDGLSWGVHVSSVPHPGHEKDNISFVWYSGLEGETNTKNEFDTAERSGYLRLDNSKNVNGYEGTVKLVGISEELGAFTLEVTDGPSTNVHPKGDPTIHPELDPRKAHYLSLSVPDDNVWKARDIFMTLLQESIQELSGDRPLEGIPPENLFIIRDLQGFEGNVHFLQKIYQGKCEFDVLFNNAVTPDQITSENLPALVHTTLEKVDKKFETKFLLKPPFTSSKHHEFAQEIVSGLLGGASYFYGDQLVDRETSLDDEEFKLVGKLEGPSELFTLVPSRPFFPRGFLWDEGFHLLPLLNYDSDLVLEIVKSWFNQIDDNGWIAREQIIGPESRSRVPTEFQVQSPEIVNPPTLTLVLIHLLNHVSPYDDIEQPLEVGEVKDKLGSFILHHPEVLTNYTRQVYPQLKKHLNMFRHSQAGSIDEFDRGTNKEAYRWRGRTVTHCLASGLDDYPRAEDVDVGELNVDLLSWIGVMTKSLRIMATLLNHTSDVTQYTQIEQDIVSNLDKLHWSDEHNCYCDVTIDDDDEDIHVCHKGYISLFPFITHLLSSSDTEKLTHIIDLITTELWTPFGIRSLSNLDSEYKTGENYWRSPIWININYLILESIQHYHGLTYSPELKEKLAKAYKELRVNVVTNVYNEWKNTGFVWEQYDDETGKHKGAKNFLGWTSLVLVMMNMPEELK
ncbi:mannosyl-oligosaccharide glucosidase [Spathaspora passalidarum NRRL Y-27907]|uniref:Mannosyl-oligosaccharide glucosidase n=1 Tax=Spathaspora passalidarum (strain NRRL Y-27907 / 11-Y1) TaxID=619300 RepID=G3AE46_SPAPN|nr:mannosyl-oligosaccharide glucosidase [Spathaspora passalidarum NRRL Y-27907]EGW35580.1 mannosyl-oligosaccharide glucosidase [Spathaspora passalidarum NRRL Y-27907]